MGRLLACVSGVVVLSWMVLGQSAENLSAFETADVQIAPRATFRAMINDGIHDGRYELRNATMFDLIKTAYGIDDGNLFGGPSWIESDRFNVIAKVPPGATPDTVRFMLQNLIKDRFKLIVHNDTKPVPAYVLTVTKGGSKLKPSSGSEKGCNQPQPVAQTPGGPPPTLTVICRDLTFAEIALVLRNMAAGYFDHPLVDETGLGGTFDFELKFTPPWLLSSAGSEGISVFDAIDKQLGLKAELSKVARPVMVIDSVNRNPTDNPPNVAQMLPPVRSEFEAAEVKLSAPGDNRNFIRPSAGGRWDASGPLRIPIGFAYDIPGNLRNDLMVVPKWVDTYRISVVAKAPTGPSSSSGGRGGTAGAITDEITLRRMVHSLLEDRFKLKAHFEDREATVYAMTLQREEPKITKADESERSSCKQDTALLPTGNKFPMIAYKCQNTTMGELAYYMGLWGGGDINHPVVDLSGLKGGYNFVLMWTPRVFLDAPSRPAETPGGLATAVDPGGISIFDAIEKQLGLKLETKKHTISVLVVDNVEPLKD